MPLPSDLAFQRVQGANRYVTYASRFPQTCFHELPSKVYCSRSADCRAWMSKNCSVEDRRSVQPYCDTGGYCMFPTDGRVPPFV